MPPLLRSLILPHHLARADCIVLPAGTEIQANLQINIIIFLQFLAFIRDVPIKWGLRLVMHNPFYTWFSISCCNVKILVLKKVMKLFISLTRVLAVHTTYTYTTKGYFIVNFCKSKKCRYQKPEFFILGLHSTLYFTLLS